VYEGTLKYIYVWEKSENKAKLCIIKEKGI
jgi:hypothetical protein